MQQQKPIVEGMEYNSDVSNEWVQKNNDITLIEQGIPFLLFNKLWEKRNLDMEYRLIRRITETQFHNQKLTDFKPNLAKMNRYNNIIPYTHSIVKLMVEEGEDDENGNYINASWINSCFCSENAFIATQGPKVETYQHFWKMIWYNDIENIVMLCQLKENDKNQCDQYWPNVNEQEKCYTNFSVTTVEETIVLEELVRRKIVMREIVNDSQNNLNSDANQDNGSQSNGGNIPREKIIYQYQFLAWNDHQTPSQQHIHLVEYIIDIMVKTFQAQKKTVVHCSAGIGRTGTLISLINAQLTFNFYKEKLRESYINRKKSNQNIDEENFDGCYTKQPQQIQEMGEQSGKISIFGIVRRLREQRWGMVHTSDQYGFIYKYLSQMLTQFF